MDQTLGGSNLTLGGLGRDTSLPFIDTKALSAKAHCLDAKASRLGSKSPNLSATRIPVAVGLLVQEGFTWLCLGVLIREGLLVQEGFAPACRTRL